MSKFIFTKHKKDNSDLSSEKKKKLFIENIRNINLTVRCIAKM